MSKYLIALVLLFPILLSAQNTQSLSPYFLVQSADNTQGEQMPLRATSAEVNIAGVIANVEIRQVYENAGKTPIEAICSTFTTYHFYSGKGIGLCMK